MERFPGSGIGDDAAELDIGWRKLLFASDAMVEGVHFRRETSTLTQAAEKVVTSNVSDIYAMGGEPVGILLTAGLPHGTGEREIAAIVDGVERACDFYDMVLLGGDTVRNPGGVFLDVAIVGSLQPGALALTRKGASPGDRIVLFGWTGGSATGRGILEWAAGISSGGGPVAGIVEGIDDPGVLLAAARDLRTGMGPEGIVRLAGDYGLDADGSGETAGAAEVLALCARHLCPAARRVGARARPAGEEDGGGHGAANDGITAMIDVSDGLASDLRKLCAASGVGAVIREEDIPVPGMLAGAPGRGDLTALALSSGEEYIALAAFGGEAVPEGGSVIGEIVGIGEGLTIIGEGGERTELPESGYEHGF